METEGNSVLVSARESEQYRKLTDLSSKPLIWEGSIVTMPLSKLVINAKRKERASQGSLNRKPLLNPVQGVRLKKSKAPRGSDPASHLGSLRDILDQKQNNTKLYSLHAKNKSDSIDKLHMQQNMMASKITYNDMGVSTMSS